MADDAPVDAIDLETTDPVSAPEPPADGVVLSVRHLSVTFKTDDGDVKAVDDATFDVVANETLGIVGESGSGKTVTAMAILGLLPASAHVSGEIVFNDRDLRKLTERQLEDIRGRRIAMIFQDALAALNPVYTIGKQIAEAIRVHEDSLDKDALRERCVELLDLVGIPNATERVDQYPHEYSGGMRQRAMIAMSIANDPEILIADEPTTALDVTIQAQVLEVLDRIQDRTRSAIMLITHDLGVVAGVADRVTVMYAGRQVETGTVDDIFYDPRHAYTAGLLASLPRLDRRVSKQERLARIEGQPPSLIHVPTGCAFNPRCPVREVPGRCSTERPELIELTPGHRSACFFPDRVVERRSHE